MAVKLKLIMCGILMCGVTFSLGLTAEAKDNFDSLRQEIDLLKEGQESIQKSLNEIKKLLKQRPQAPQRKSPIQEVDLELSLANAPSKGDAQAPVVLVEFSDYQCPFCARVAKNTFPQIDKEYVQTGKVRYVFRDFPLESIHKDAAKAAEAARCAGDQGRYWEMHDELFKNRKNLGLEKLPGYARTVGLDIGIFQACLDSGKYGEIVRQDLKDGQKAGVRGTPTFFVGRADGGNQTFKASTRLRGAQGFGSFQKAIEALLKDQPAG